MSADKARAAELKRLANMKDEDIDTSDIPEVTDWSRAEVGKFYRPVKKQVTLRIDADVLAWFKSQSAKYQTEINSVLRERFLKSMKNPSPSAFHARTGEICPQSGTWTLVGDPRTSISVSKGDRMPSLKKRRVVWVQLKAA